mmetsp:Transcript_4824/g.14319  ORF Transcript_4824/g.14319 Transcript_4824/m.14319 type:complete len:210 (-) Transcript_4824:43-672(-)
MCTSANDGRRRTSTSRPRASPTGNDSMARELAFALEMLSDPMVIFIMFLAYAIPLSCILAYMGLGYVAASLGYVAAIVAWLLEISTIVLIWFVAYCCLATTFCLKVFPKVGGALVLIVLQNPFAALENVVCAFSRVKVELVDPILQPKLAELRGAFRGRLERFLLTCCSTCPRCCKVYYRIRYLKHAFDLKELQDSVESRELVVYVPGK